MLTQRINWKELAQLVKGPDIENCVFSSDDGNRAIEIIIGDDQIRDAVDYYIGLYPGFEVVRMMLMQIRPWSGMNRCYEKYHSESNVQRKCLAIGLLGDIGDSRAGGWIREFLSSPDIDIQRSAADTLEQMVWRKRLNREQVEELVAVAEVHTNEHVRRRAVEIRAHFRRQFE